jgi:hypothetical protein
MDTGSEKEYRSTEYSFRIRNLHENCSDNFLLFVTIQNFEARDVNIQRYRTLRLSP